MEKKIIMPPNKDFIRRYQNEINKNNEQLRIYRNQIKRANESRNPKNYPLSSWRRSIKHYLSVNKRLREFIKQERKKK